MAEMDEHDDCRIKSIYNWTNGMTMVFCEHGQQMPSLQGRTEEVRSLIDARVRAGHVVQTVEIVEGAEWARR